MGNTVSKTNTRGIENVNTSNEVLTFSNIVKNKPPKKEIKEIVVNIILLSS